MASLDFLDDYVSREQLAAALKCSSRTLARYEKMADGLASVMIAGRKHYRKQTIVEWFQRRERVQNPRRR